MDTKKLMSSVPELPEDFEMWVRNVPLGHSKYMFTFRENGDRKGFCSHCEIIVDLEWRNLRTYTDEEFQNCNRKHNEKGYCPECHSPVTFKDNGRGKSNLWDYSKAILLQRIGNVACFRFFDVMRNYIYCDKSPVKTQITEEYRLFLDPVEHKAEMYKRDICYGCKWAWLYYGGCEMGVVESISDWYKLTRVNTNLNRYGISHFYNLDELTTLFADTDFKYCDIDAYQRSSTYQYRNFIKYVTLFCRYPKAVEYLIKAGFSVLFADYMTYPTQHVLNLRAKTPEKLFKLSKAHIKYFKTSKIGMSCRDLDYLQELEAANLPENVFRYLYENSDSYDFNHGWKNILKYTTYTKAVNYLAKQKKVSLMPARYYSDYIIDCEKLEYDLAEHSVLFPRDLHVAHSRTIELIRAKEEAERKARTKQQRIEAAKKNAAFSKNIQKQFDELCMKYEFHSNGLFIRPAKDMKEIKAEGETQNICVGSDNQQYIKNHAAGIAFILFIRKESEPDKPFYTVEITKSDYVAQCRGKHNQGQTDEVQAFMIAFQKYLRSQTAQKSA